MYIMNINEQTLSRNLKLKVVEFSERNGNSCAGRESRRPRSIWRATHVVNVLAD